MAKSNQHTPQKRSATPTPAAAKAKSTVAQPVATAGQEGSALWWLLAILAVTVVCFFPSINADFVLWDDDAYVKDNNLLQPLSWATFYKIWTNEVSANYNPWAIWSLAIDNQFFGKKGIESAVYYHIHNLILHLFNIVLVYWWMRLLRLSQKASLLVSLLFGIHTMRVESVSWITERKDVLFGFYFVAAAIAYHYYAEAKAQSRKILFYLVSLGLAFMSCASKIQGTTFFGGMLMVDLLMHRRDDWNPILGGYLGGNRGQSEPGTWSIDWRKMLYFALEKIPFLIVSLTFFYVGLQYLAVTMDSGTLFPLWQRLFFAPYAIFVYIWKFFTPILLSACHPYPSSATGFIPWYMFASAIPVTALVAFIFWKYRNNPYVLFGAGFFFVNIAPLLQIVGAGQGFLAERFTYIAYIGFFFLVGIFWDKLQAEQPQWKNIAQGGLLVWLVALAALTFERAGVWKNSETLWTDVLKKYEFVDVAYNNRGTYLREKAELLQKEGKIKESQQLNAAAMSDFSKILERKPDDVNVYVSRGNLYFSQNENEKAAADYDRALKLCETQKDVKQSLLSKAWGNRGAIYFRNAVAINQLDKLPESNALLEKSVYHFTKSLEIDSAYAEGYVSRACSHSVMANNYKALQNLEASEREHRLARADYEKCISYQPDHFSAHNWLGLEYAYFGEWDKSIAAYTSAIKHNPAANKGEYYFNRSIAYRDSKTNKEAAIADAKRAVEMGWPNADVLLKQLIDAK